MTDLPGGDSEQAARARRAEKLHRLATACFVGSAATLPWGTLQQLTSAGLDLASLLALAGCAFTLPGIRADRLRVPFELVWPVVLLAVIGLVPTPLQPAGISPGMVVVMAAGFLGAAHATRHAGAFRVALACCALCAPLPPLLTAAVQLRVFFPEAWSPSGMALLGFPDPESMAGATLICAGSACILAARGLLLRNWTAAGWLIPAFLSAAILVPLYLFLGVGSAEVTPSGAAFTPARLPATLLVLYLAARIGAKLAVAARVRRDPELVLASLICLLGAPVAILWTPGPVPLAVAAGMLAGPAISRGRDTACPPSRLWRVLPGLPVALALLRLAVPLPGDPRDYVVRADILVRQQRADEAETLLRRVLAWCPEESRAAWQMAWLRLYQDEPDGAAYWAARSLRQSGSGLPPRFFPHPGPEEVQAFLNAVRDSAAVHTMEGTGGGTMALARVLFAAGRHSQALALLDALTRDEPCPEAIPSDTLRSLVVWLLDISEETLPESLPPDALWAALRTGSSLQILPVPRELSGVSKVLALAARVEEGWTDVLVLSGNASVGASGRWFVECRPAMPSGVFAPEDADSSQDERPYRWAGPLPGGSPGSWWAYHAAGIAVRLDAPKIEFRQPDVHCTYRPQRPPDIQLLVPNTRDENTPGNETGPAR